MLGKIIGLNDADIIEAVRHIHPKLGNYRITRGKPEAYQAGGESISQR